MMPTDTDERFPIPGSPRSEAWRRARRILAIRLDNLGDVLMTTPALRALRDSAPERHITLLTSAAGAAAAAYLPEVNDIVRCNNAPWMPGGAATPSGLQDLVSLLQMRTFDAAVIFTVYSQNPLPAALLCWQAGIPLRLAHCRENPYQLLSDWVPDPEPHEILRHEVRRQLDLVAAIGCKTDDERLSFRLRTGDTVAVVARLRAAGIAASERLVVVHPGASAPSRRYPPERYAAAIGELANGEPRCRVVLSGDINETALVQQIYAALPESAQAATVSLAGELTLGELAALISMAAVLIANNTGPVHIAAAVGTPVVDIYALTNPQHAPWQVPNEVLYHDVPCRFCYRSVCPQGHHACLNLLDPARVANAAHALLQGGADRAAPPATRRFALQPGCN